MKLSNMIKIDWWEVDFWQTGILPIRKWDCDQATCTCCTIPTALNQVVFLKIYDSILKEAEPKRIHYGINYIRILERQHGTMGYYTVGYKGDFIPRYWGVVGPAKPPPPKPKLSEWQQWVFLFNKLVDIIKSKL